MQESAASGVSPFVATHETHTAVLVMLGDRAYKVKKPVDLGFVDFTGLEARRAACEEEVVLNRRLAPDVYLGTAQVTGPDGEVCEHMVVMRRMPAQRSLAALVRRRVDVSDELRGLARMLAAFHGRAERGPHIDQQVGVDALAQRWNDLFQRVAAFRDGLLPEIAVAEVEEGVGTFLSGRRELFDDRIAAGYAVEGHGDLLAADVYCLDDGPRVLDCLEFTPRLRYLDPLDDAAFLAMDLEYLGAPDLAALFLDAYAEYSGDPAPPALRHHYVAYRAFVRVMTACMRHAQGGLDGESARRHLDLAVRHLRQGAVRLVLVGGLPGTGKSTLAGELADGLGAVLLSSDRVRKEGAGINPHASARGPLYTGTYAPERTQLTYRQLLERAEALLVRGETVVLDASWNAAAHRVDADGVAARCHAELVALRCEADQETVRARLAARAPGASASDADAEVAAALAANTDPWPEAVTIDTSGPLGASAAAAFATIRPWAAQLPRLGRRPGMPPD